MWRGLGPREKIETQENVTSWLFLKLPWKTDFKAASVFTHLSCLNYTYIRIIIFLSFLKALLSIETLIT